MDRACCGMKFPTACPNTHCQRAREANPRYQAGGAPQGQLFRGGLGGGWQQGCAPRRSTHRHPEATATGRRDRGCRGPARLPGAPLRLLHASPRGLGAGARRSPPGPGRAPHLPAAGLPRSPPPAGAARPRPALPRGAVTPRSLCPRPAAITRPRGGPRGRPRRRLPGTAARGQVAAALPAQRCPPAAAMPPPCPGACVPGPAAAIPPARLQRAGKCRATDESFHRLSELPGRKAGGTQRSFPGFAQR